MQWKFSFRLSSVAAFTRTAEALDLTTGMVSHHIANLEKHVGVRLLHRTTRTVSVTHEGKLYYDHCTSVLGDIYEVQRILSQSRVSPRGRVRVGLSSTMISGLVIPAWERFNERFPQIELELHHTGIYFGANFDDFDVMLRYGPFDDSDLVVRRLMDASTVTVASPTYLKRFGEPSTPDDLPNHRCLNSIDPKTGRSREWRFHKDERDYLLKVHGLVSFNEGRGRVEAAILGLGITQTTNYHVKNELRDGVLQEILADWMSPNRLEVGLLYKKGKYLPARVRAFIDFMAEIYPPNASTNIEEHA